MKSVRRSLLLLALFLSSVLWQARAGTWAALSNAPPAGVNLMLLLSDGTVMANQYMNPGGAKTWYRLVPDSHGSYLNGTWTNMASMNANRLFFASCVMRDGRVLVAGGEYGDPGCQFTAEVYDPANNTWTYTPSAGVQFADSESVILPDGKVLVSGVFSGITNVIYDPVANNWLRGPNNIEDQDEATWIKLPDDSILTIDPYRPFDPVPLYGTNSERYVPALNQWIKDANLPFQMWDQPVSEIGGALLLPDGRAFFLGGSGHTALYTPSGNTNRGTWTEGARIMPPGYVARDAPAAMMANGKVLCIVGNSNYVPPAVFLEYDYSVGATGAFAAVDYPASLSGTNAGPLAMLDLPDGNVLVPFVETNGAPVLFPYLYQPDPPPFAAGKPTVTSVRANADASFHLTGTLLNGTSQGSSLGDDLQMDSNYPLVRLTNNAAGDVRYARTFNWSSTGVQTSNKLVSTEFTLPYQFVNRGPSQYSLVAVANGIASDPVTFYGPVWVDFNYLGATQNGSFDFPYKTLTNGINACPVNGTIICKGPATHRETPRITKAVTIVASGGTVTVGR